MMNKHWTSFLSLWLILLFSGAELHWVYAVSLGGKRIPQKASRKRVQASPVQSPTSSHRRVRKKQKPADPQVGSQSAEDVLGAIFSIGVPSPPNLQQSLAVEMEQARQAALEVQQALQKRAALEQQAVLEAQQVLQKRAALEQALREKAAQQQALQKRAALEQALREKAAQQQALERQSSVSSSTPSVTTSASSQSLSPTSSPSPSSSPSPPSSPDPSKLPFRRVRQLKRQRQRQASVLTRPEPVRLKSQKAVEAQRVKQVEEQIKKLKRSIPGGVLFLAKKNQPLSKFETYVLMNEQIGKLYLSVGKKEPARIHFERALNHIEHLIKKLSSKKKIPKKERPSKPTKLDELRKIESRLQQQITSN